MDRKQTILLERLAVLLSHARADGLQTPHANTFRESAHARVVRLHAVRLRVLPLAHLKQQQQSLSKKQQKKHKKKEEKEKLVFVFFCCFEDGFLMSQ